MACQQRCVVPVGHSGILKICICELASEHDGDCERIPTTRWATVGDVACLPVYKNFLATIDLRQKPGREYDERKIH